MNPVPPADPAQGDLFAPASAGALRRADEQRAAITAPVDAHLRIVAGPGAGKTHVLVGRIQHLLAEGVAPERIAVVTYTNSARDELLERLGEALGGERLPFVGTIHQLCLGFVQRSSGPESGRVRVLDPTAAERLFAVQVVAGGDPRQVLAEVSLAWERYAGAGDPPAGPDQAAWTAFEASLRRSGLATFTSLQLWALEVVADGLEPVPAHVLVDEFQDTTGLQVRVLEALAARGARIAVVGDPEQSVFRFAGADRDHLPDFARRFQPCTEIALAANGRSSGAIVGLAGRLRAAGEQFALREDGQRPRLWYLIGEAQQAERVAGEVASLVHERGISPGRVAVRAREGQSAAVAQRLEAARVPVWLPRAERFASKPHVRNLVIALEALAEPGDERACFFLFDQIVRGAPKTWEAVRAELVEGSGLDRAVEVARDKVARPRQASLGQLAQVRATLAGLAQAGPADRVRAVAAEVLAPRFSLRERKRAAAIQADLERVAEAAGERDGPLELAAWIRQGGLAVAPGGDAVTVASLHFAKGREWDVVFLIDLTRGVLPHRHNPDREEERRLLHVGVSRAREQLYLCAPERLPGRGEGVSPLLTGLADACQVSDLRGEG